jgi:hypothetical protein
VVDVTERVCGVAERSVVLGVDVIGVDHPELAEVGAAQDAHGSLAGRIGSFAVRLAKKKLVLTVAILIAHDARHVPASRARCGGRMALVLSNLHQPIVHLVETEPLRLRLGLLFGVVRGLGSAAGCDDGAREGCACDLLRDCEHGKSSSAAEARRTGTGGPPYPATRFVAPATFGREKREDRRS